MSFATTSSHLDSLEIGFGIGYLNRASRFEAALQRIAADGFRYVRAYEPFPAQGDDEQILQSLSVLTKHGLIPFLGLSNFPYDLRPASPRAMAGARYTETGRDEILRYSNRYPPADLNAYRARVARLLEQLDSAFGRTALRGWYFEIGNEPDAPRFFWGSDREFKAIYDAAAQTFRAFDPELRIGGAGFTSSLVVHPEAKPGFLEIARAIADSADDDFLSFHVYASSFPGFRVSAQLVGSFVDAAPQGVISEWNVSSQAPTRVQRIFDSDEFVRYLVDAVTVCYETGVALLLVHKLMNDPSRGDNQLGLFDRNGEPRAAYHHVKRMRDIVGNGYTVSQDSGSTLVRGRELALALGREGNPEFDYSGYEVIESSFARSGGSGLPAGGWVYLRIQRDEAGAKSPDGKDTDYQRTKLSFPR